jgi:hypothetical protein
MPWPHLLGLQRIEVYEVASFYSMFNLHPVGTYVLDVCRTTPCMLRGSDELIAHLEKKLGVHCGGDHQADGMFTLKAVECLGSCGSGADASVRCHYHENLTIESVDSLDRCSCAPGIHGPTTRIADGPQTPFRAHRQPPASVGWRATVRTAATAAWRRP